MEFKIIKSFRQYQQYLDWMDEMFEGEKLQVAPCLIQLQLLN
ncbi:MAG: hypothetical protein ACR2KB_07505 [Chitinophagaceae bacterium]